MKYNAATYWEFGWEELGTHDIPAFTDYVLTNSKHNKLAFIGHSMATNAATFALTQKLAYYQNRWSIYIALGPPWSMPNVASFMFNMARNEMVFDPLQSIFSFFNIENIYPANWFNRSLFKYTCIWLPFLCSLGAYFVSDLDTLLNDETAFKVFMSHYPSGASTK